MTNTEFKTQLLRKYVNNQANEQELEAVRHLISTGEVDDQLHQVMDEVWATSNNETITAKSTKKLSLKNWAWLSAAAAVIILGVYLIDLVGSSTSTFKKNTLVASSPVLPGKNTAVITLANGKHIELSSAQSGIVLGTKSVRYNDGSAIDLSADEIAKGSITTISTPRGGTYRVTLADGSTIQLNAESSISFNADLAKRAERRINLTGEAYFEVAKRKDRPFIVVSRNQEVKVLGTHFNVRAYNDDAYDLTTLIEGSININETLLKPNEQAKQVGGRVTVKEVDSRIAIDWINGEFYFGNDPLEEIMKKVSRWYDVEVAYESDRLRQKTFSGSLSRYSNVEDLLNALKFAGINSKLNNRKIYITN